MRGHGPFFNMPQPAAREHPPAEQNPAALVEAVLREHIACTAAARDETRQARHELREVLMKVSELSGKVDTLVSLATTIKQTSDNAGNQNPPVAEDDPEVQSLGDRIDRAIAILQGNAPPVPAPPVIDPNAPAV